VRLRRVNDSEQQITRLLWLTAQQAERIERLELENKELDRKRKAWLMAAAA